MDVETASNPDLAADLHAYKHIPIAHRGGPRRTTRNQLIRTVAKRLAESDDPAALCREDMLNCAAPGDNYLETVKHEPYAFRNHIERALHSELRLNPDAHAVYPGRRHQARDRRRDADEAHDGEALARSDVPLPSDRFRLVRCPSLEREDAFRDANTCKGRGPAVAAPMTDDAQVAQLYRMGLLYSDEKDRRFSLDSIRHEQPLYSIRPAKRARGWNSKPRGDGDADQGLDLDLSFADLGNDEAIAQFLMSTSSSSASESRGDDEPIQHRQRRSPMASPPLRVIYELDGSKPSFDVDTSQPPDLIIDSLSDYDYFSDGEMDDTPSQRELHDPDSAPATDAWVILGDDL